MEKMKATRVSHFIRTDFKLPAQGKGGLGRKIESVKLVGEIYLTNPQDVQDILATIDLHNSNDFVRVEDVELTPIDEAKEQKK